MNQPILVTGATGNTGRHVVAGLLDEGMRVRALTRDPSRADLPDEAEVVAGDVTCSEDVAAAAKGVSAAYLVWPGTDAEAARARSTSTSGPPPAITTGRPARSPASMTRSRRL